jgi:hypothetical protein
VRCERKRKAKQIGKRREEEGKQNENKETITTDGRGMKYYNYNAQPGLENEGWIFQPEMRRKVKKRYPPSVPLTTVHVLHMYKGGRSLHPMSSLLFEGNDKDR